MDSYIYILWQSTNYYGISQTTQIVHINNNSSLEQQKNKKTLLSLNFTILLYFIK